jgi:hypothetical protein
MLRLWVQIILMAILMLIQTACPKFLMQQNNDVRVHPSDDSDGGSSSG